MRIEVYREGTVFVVGAGASCDFGFPLGRDLKREIYALLQPGREFSPLHEQHFYTGQLDNGAFDRELDGYLEELGINLRGQRKISTTQFICEAMPFTSSIDNFLQNNAHRPDVAAIAKAAISWIISDYEARVADRIAPKSRGDTVSIDETWHQVFVEDLFANAQAEQVDEALGRIRLISFNYDRCIEQIVRVALSRLYPFDNEEALGRLAALTVYHPYGSLGEIARGRTSSTFGDRSGWQAAARQIRTFGEMPTANEEIASVCAKAERVVFLGFGFHQPNMRLLSSRGRVRSKQVFGTTYGLEPAAEKAVKSTILHAFGNNIDNVVVEAELKATTCKKLLEEYRAALVE